MDSEFISNALQNHETRVNIIKKNVNIYFEYKADKNCYISKSTINNENSQAIEFILNQNDIKKCLERSINIKYL